MPTNRLALSALAVAVAFTASTATIDAAQTTAHPSRAVVALFAPIASGLSKSGVAVLLPGALPKDDLQGLRAELRSANANGYEIELDYAAGCNGATACHLGTISGSRSSGSKLSGKPVRLPIGVTGYYVPGPCGASCSDSSVSFVYRGNLYAFAAKGGSLAYLSQWTSSIARLADLVPQR